MTIKLGNETAETLAEIPPEVRPAVVRWLHANAASAAGTASQLRIQNRVNKSDTVEKIAAYWASIDKALRLVASRMSSANDIPSRCKREKDDER